MAEQSELSRKAARVGRILLQVPITEAERRRLKHKAVDQGVTLGAVVRAALGFPPNVEHAEDAAM